MVSKRTLNEIMKSFLDKEGFNDEEIKEIMKEFTKCVKTTKKKVKVRHGTSCFGVTIDEEIIFEI